MLQIAVYAIRAQMSGANPLFKLWLKLGQHCFMTDASLNLERHMAHLLQANAETRNFPNIQIRQLSSLQAYKLTSLQAYKHGDPHKESK